jgi:hypothetical protein
MAHLEASERVCSTDLCHDALELVLVLEQLTDLFFVVARHLFQPAGDVAREYLHHEWRGAVRIEVQEMRDNLLSQLEVLREVRHHDRVCIGLAVLACVCRWVVQVICPLERQGPTECQDSVQHQGREMKCYGNV